MDLVSLPETIYKILSRLIKNSNVNGNTFKTFEGKSGRYKNKTKVYNIKRNIDIFYDIKINISQALASGQDRITKIWISRPTWNNNRTDKIHKMVAIKTLSIWNKRTVTPERWGSRWGRPPINLSRCGFEVSELHCNKRDPNRAQSSPWVEQMELGLMGRPGWVYRGRMPNKRGSLFKKKGTLEGADGFRKHSPEHWLVFASEEILTRVENLWKYYEGKLITAYKEESVCSQQAEWKSSQFQRIEDC